MLYSKNINGFYLFGGKGGRQEEMEQDLGGSEIIL